MKEIQANKILHWIKIRKLYRKAFPRNERKPLGIIKSMQKKGKTDVWYFQQDGKFVGMAITINSDELILIDYFAVAEEARGMGIGSSILRRIQEIYSEKGIFLEVEQVYETAANLEERKRRKQFYLANGMSELNVTAKVFGVDMELLGTGCQLDYEGYRSFYRENYGEFAANRIMSSDVSGAK